MFIVMLLLSISYSVGARSENPRKIVQNSVYASLIKSVFAKEVHLISVTKSGKKKHKVYKLWRKRIGKTSLNKTMSRFILPKKIKGQGVLIIESNGEKGNEIRLYLPAYKKVRRIERQMQSGSFMGTAFSHSDLVTHVVSDYTYKYKKLVKCPHSKDIKCHVIGNYPKNEKIQDRRGYHSFFTWIRSDNFMLEKLVGFNNKKEIIKKLDLLEIIPVGKKWFISKIIAKDYKSKRSATYHVKNIDVNQSIDDSVFLESFLKNP